MNFTTCTFPVHFRQAVNKWINAMSFVGFSPKLHLAMRIAKTKGAAALPVDQAEKDRRKQVSNARVEKQRVENLAQRALVESRRRGSASMN